MFDIITNIAKQYHLNISIAVVKENARRENAEILLGDTFYPQANLPYLFGFVLRRSSIPVKVGKYPFFIYKIAPPKNGL